MTEWRWLQYATWAMVWLVAWPAPAGAGCFESDAGVGSSQPTPASAKGSLPPAPKGYLCYRAAGPIQVDGRLDEAAWQAAPWTGSIRRHRRGRQAKAAVPDSREDALG